MSFSRKQKGTFVLAVFAVLVIAYQNCSGPVAKSLQINDNSSLSSRKFCTSPSGSIVADGESITLYSSNSAGCGSVCASAQVKCNGTQLDSSEFVHPTCEQKLCATWDTAESSNLPSLSFSPDLLTVTKDDKELAVRCSAYGSVWSSSEKYYFEVTVINQISGTNQRIGLASREGRIPNDAPIALYSIGYGFNGTLHIYDAGTSGSTPSWGAAYSSGDVIGVMVNHDLNQVTFHKNGVIQGKAVTLKPGVEYSPFYFGGLDSNAVLEANFGATPFKYPPPTGFNRYNYK